MTQATITLLAVALLSFVFKDLTLTAAATILAILTAVDAKPVLGVLQKHSFQIGIFFLMIFILLPVAMQKVKLLEIGKELFSIAGILAVASGVLISYLGGKGAGVLPGEPVILSGVILGTLVAVLFFKGLPAGLIIAAGLAGIACKYLN